MFHVHARAGLGGRELPADDGGVGNVLVPVREPRIGENAGRIVLDNFPVTLELADTVHHDGAFFSGVTVMAAEARVHLPELRGTFRGGEPALEFSGAGQSLKDAVGGRRDFNLADDRVLIGR